MDSNNYSGMWEEDFSNHFTIEPSVKSKCHMVAILQIKLSYQKHKTLPKNYNNIFANQQTIKNFEIKVKKIWWKKDTDLIEPE